MFGMFTGIDGNKYNICIPSPFVRDSKAEAMKDENFAYRFWVIDSAGPMLVAFANEHFESMNNGKMQLRCWVDKDAVGDHGHFPEPDPHGMPPEPCHEHPHD